jgi:MYXO-CTERM domain-containing protein
MNRAISLSALGVLLLASGEALPCGGAFGNTVAIDPIQKIIVSYKNGVETYILNPYFCGNSDSFGLILPVPATLTQNPTLGQTQLYTDIGKVAAPIIQTQTACTPLATGGTKGTGGAASSSVGSGTTVINRGQVGIFDWVLLQATSTTAFTDWLTANGFPYQATSQTAFNYYVSAGWYFVAFKVSTGGGTSGSGGAGGAGTGGVGGKSNTTGSIPPNTSPITSGGTAGGTTRICGNFGPVMLSFTSATQPVVPARIAAVSSNQLNWTLYTLAAESMRLRDYASTLQFSGALATTDLASYPSLAPIAQAGDRLTELLISLPASSITDLVLELAPGQADYRRTEIQTVYVSCATGGTTSTSLGTGGLVYGTGGTPTGYGGSAAGGLTNVGGATPAGGTANNGGAAGNGATPAVGGAISTGGVVATGGFPGTGGLSPAGGMPGNGGASSAGGSNTSGGAPNTGAVVNTGGVLGIGGTPRTSATSTSDRQSPGQKNDDGGCAIRSSSTGSRKTGTSLLAALLGLGALYRRRRQNRRK